MIDRSRRFPAVLVLALLALMVLAPMAGLLSLGRLPGYEAADLRFWESAYLRRVLFFSLWQALLSALLSVLPAILVARAFALQPDLPLRRVLLRLFALPLVVPAVVAVMAVVSVYGSDGWLPLGRSLYGLNGILIAHVFFNLPLAVRLLLPQWQAIPRHHWQLSEQLGMNSWQRWRFLEWPMLREALPGVVLLVFMLCLTSFAVLLTLGGGPRSTTLEVAIYQSLRFDFDPARAVVLALLQLGLCMLVAVVTLKLQRLAEVEMLMPRPPSPPLPQEWLRAPARTPRQPEPFGVVPADPAPAPAPSIPVRAALEPPQVDLTRCPEPNYPRAARRLGQQGVVEVLVTVDAEGLPTSVEAHLSSGFSLLDHAAVRAVEAWRFHPARDAEGAAVSGEIVVPVRFRLGGER